MHIKNIERGYPGSQPEKVYYHRRKMSSCVNIQKYNTVDNSPNRTLVEKLSSSTLDFIRSNGNPRFTYCIMPYQQNEKYTEIYRSIL